MPTWSRARAVTPNDTTPINAEMLYVGTGGNVTVKTRLSDQSLSAVALFANVPSGTFLPVEAAVVMSTGTTATDIVALGRD